MRIRLKLTTPGGQTTLFQHDGPVVRIGRDPSCELLLEGEDVGKAASRLHARIELTPDGARLLDMNSANKTLHNTRPIYRPVPLKPGDRIQIGYTGTALTVLDLDLAPPAPASVRRLDPRVLITLGCGLAACLALLCTVRFWPRGTPSTPEPSAQITPQPAPQPVPTPVPQPIPKKQDSAPPPALPSVEVRTVGHYLRLRDRRPSVLLQRAGENHRWTVLGSGQAVSTAHTLLSLPGYESLVSLDSGLRLNLWGSLPEFGAPVLESAIMLNNPGAEVDLDLTLDRGRVEIDSGNAPSGRRVRLRFLHEIWDLVLVEKGTKVCVELWQPQTGAAGAEARRCFGLFSRGKVRVKTGHEERDCSSFARLAWISTEPRRVFHEKLSAPPPWWDKPPEPTSTLADILLSLGDWATQRLDQSPDAIDKAVTVVHQSKDRTERLLGVWFLAALDISSVIEFLEDKDSEHADIRNTAMYALRDWLVRNIQRRETLIRMIQQQRKYAQVNADLMVSLLLPFSARQLEDPTTYQELIDRLDHEKLAIRHLAAQHLYAELADRMPPEALKIDYDPTQEPEKRQEAVAQWRKVLPKGKLPRRSPSK